jgi:chromosome segregation ATPase
MSSITSPKEELEKKISELEESLSELKRQLHQQEEKEQHEAIDNLELYLEQIDNKYENLRNFWPIVVDELRDFFKGSSDDVSRRF